MYPPKTCAGKGDREEQRDSEKEGQKKVGWKKERESERVKRGVSPPPLCICMIEWPG